MWSCCAILSCVCFIDCCYGMVACAVSFRIKFYYVCIASLINGLIIFWLVAFLSRSRCWHFGFYVNNESVWYYLQIHKIPCILCAHLQKGRQAADFAISADRLGPPIKRHWFFSQKEIYYHLFKLFARPIRNVARSASWPAGQSVHCQSSCTCF